MKNKLIVFTSALMATILISSCSNDDNDTNNGTDTPSSSDIVVAEKYKDIKSANREISAVVKDAMSNSSNAGRSAKNMSNDCTKLTSEMTDTGAIATIDYGSGCTSPDGKAISGKIIITYKINEESTDLALDITYSLENFAFNGITVSGNSIATFSLGDLTTGAGQDFVTNSNYVFTWEDGLKVTSTDKTSIKNVIDQQNANTFHSLVTLNSEASFSTGDVLISKTTSPLKVQSDCKYVVSGILVTSENGTTSNTLDYGDGTCDNIATQTDSDGNTTTIDLDVQLEENFVI